MHKEVPQLMRAAVLTKPGHLELQDVPVPEVKSSDVLIQVKACAVCSSDISLMENPWPGQPPFGSFIPGHEYAGIVAAVGSSVDEVSVGDHVAVEVHYGCGRCENCRRGYYTACLHWGDTQKGHWANGLTANGGFAEYALNHVSTVYRMPKTVPFAEASLITNLGCVLYGFELTGGFIVGASAAVVGDGPIGLLAVQVARLLGADSVTLIGMDPYRLELGKQMGADRVINIADEDPEAVCKTSFNGGVDIAVEASGSADGLRNAALLPKWTGKTLVFGIPKGDASINFHDFIRGNKFMYTVRGEGLMNCKGAVSLLKHRRIDLKSLVTHSFTLEELNQAIQAHKGEQGQAIKVVVTP